MTLLYSQSCKIKALILILILLITHHSFPQKKIEIKDKIPIYKNSLKGFVFAFPIYGVSVSLGYERAITKQSTIEFGIYYRFFLDEMGLKYHTTCIMPAYKYYTVSENKMLNDFWISIYLSHLFETHKHPESEDDIRHSLYHYGIGSSIGKRLYLNSQHKTFFDIGFGVSYNYYTDQSMFSTIDWWSNTLLYRPIIQIGRKF